ncbi:SDR family oxidoreductase [Hoeflea sp. YIM 152468]|uniref:SDR family oxidoreductase n=1 Tax=Hoeflea sp. YIM 152468 TaxID=3031759 RepID=UPI0023DCBAA7|nr:SDR family oxidoreductase [Hoeflea sp. YIM 152468]MDF1608035.1 SDR family oxidoreductase [Hoeflea sp. YIM 152468]
MNGDNQRKSILVTGCSSGIGAYCARALKAEGWQVIASARTAEDIARLHADGLEAFHLDYADPASIAEFFALAMDATGGRCDALFNNGGYGQVGAVEDLDTDVLRAQFEANFFGWHDLTRRVIPVMRTRGHGRIVQCSSILGLVPMRFRGAYNASKHAIEGLSVTLAMELEDTDIHVSLIEPGAIVSRFRANALKHFHREIDIEGSVHRQVYQAQLRRLEKQEQSDSGKLGPDAVHKVLRHALTADRPRFHYAVTREAKLGVMARRMLPASLLYPWLAKKN